jgi:hypothetical protein
MPYLCTAESPDGGIGRRAGLKHQWIHFHAGSTPALGTRKHCKRLVCSASCFNDSFQFNFTLVILNS